MYRLLLFFRHTVTALDRMPAESVSIALNTLSRDEQIALRDSALLLVAVIEQHIQD
jgi:hypothetical protein